jgi:hypothetical protein
VKKYCFYTGILFQFFTDIDYCRGKEGGIESSLIPVNEVQNTTSWGDLPYEILKCIGENLDIYSRINASRVDRKMKKVIRDSDKNFYKAFDKIESIFYELKDLKWNLKRYFAIKSIYHLIKRPQIMPSYDFFFSNIEVYFSREKKRYISGLLQEIEKLEERKEDYFKDSFLEDKDYIRKIRSTEIIKEGAQEFVEEISSILKRGADVTREYKDLVESFDAYLAQYIPNNIKEDFEEKVMVYPAQIKRIENIIEKSKELGVPYDPMVDKIYKFEIHELRRAEEILKLMAQQIWPKTEEEFSVEKGKEILKIVKNIVAEVEEKHPTLFYCHSWDVESRPFFCHPGDDQLKKLLDEEEEKLEDIKKQRKKKPWFRFPFWNPKKNS